MTLAQAVLEIFCSQGSIGLQWESRKNVEKGHNSAMESLTEKKKKIQVLLFIILIPHIKFQDPISNRSWLYAKHNAPCMDGRTGPNQYASWTSSKFGMYKLSKKVSVTPEHRAYLGPSLIMYDKDAVKQLRYDDNSIVLHRNIIIMLWVLIRIALPRRFLCFYGEI